MRRLIMLLIAGTAVVAAHVPPVRAQAAAAPSEFTGWQGWAFARVGVASTSPPAVVSVFTSGGSLWGVGNAGLAVSRGRGIAVARLGGGGEWVGYGLIERALLGGVRTRGDHFFVAAAGGAADVTPTYNSDGGGSSVSRHTGAFAYDLSAHGAYRLAGLELALSGVAGGSRRSYVALTLGLDVGWLGL